jgi:hypothetical protein
MKIVNAYFSILCLVLLAGCSTTAVQHDYDHESDFTSLKTYNWRPVERKSNISDLAVKTAKDAVNRQLAAKGFSQTSTNPDFSIAMYLGTQIKRDTMDYGYFYKDHRRHYRARWGRAPLDAYNYEEGTMIIDFVNAKTNELIWRGSLKEVIDPVVTPERLHRKLNDAAEKILEDFPPKGP